MGLSSSPPSFQAHYITALSIRTHVNIFRIPPSSSSKRKRKRPVQQSSNIQQQHQRKSSPPPLHFSSRRRLFFLDARLRGSLLLPNVESPPPLLPFLLPTLWGARIESAFAFTPHRQRTCTRCFPSSCLQGEICQVIPQFQENFFMSNSYIPLLLKCSVSI